MNIANRVGVIAAAVLIVLILGFRADELRGQTTQPIAGIVVNEQGKPVGDAQVDCALGTENTSTRTTADGHFEIQRKTAMQFWTLVARSADGKLAAFSPAGLHGAKGGNGDAPAAESRMDEMRLVLKPVHEFAITVVDAKDNPVEGAWIAMSSNFAKTGEATTDAGGHATLRVPVDAPPQGIVTLKDGVGLDYVLFAPKNWQKTDPYHLDPDFAGPIKFVLNGATSVTVKVVDDQSRPIEGVSVQPWYFMKPRKGDDFNNGLGELHRTTDAQGIARFDFVPADNTQAIQFWTRLDGWNAPQRCYYDPAKGQTALQTTMQRLIRVTGRVIDAEGHGVGGATIHADGECFEIDNFRSDSVVTGDDGAFALDVNPEMYYMFAATKEKLVSPGVLRMIHKASPPPVEMKLEVGRRVFGSVTAGAQNQPTTRSYVTLVHEDDGTYYKLAKEEQFPGETIGRKWIAPRITLNGRTDEQGKFEFYTSSGKHSLFSYAPGNQLSQQFVIGFEAEKEVNLHAAEARSGPRMLSGRVVLREKPDTPVGEATIEGASVKFEQVRSEGVADRQGNFNLPRGDSDLYLFAQTPDKKLAGAAVAKSGETKATIEVGPTAKVHGRVLDFDGKPIADRQIEYGIRIGPPKGPWSTRFGGNVRTSADGMFEAGGLVPGFDYEFSAVMEIGDQGLPRSWQPLKTVKADRADQVVDLGEVKMAKPYAPPKPEDSISQYFGIKDPLATRFDKARHIADGSLQNVLIVLAAPDSAAVKDFFKLWRDMDNSAVGEAFAGFVPLFVKVNGAGAADARAWADAHKLTWPADGAMTFAVFDAKGALLTQANDQSLSADRKLQSAKLIAFAKANTPTLPDAKVLFDAALAQAKQQDKRVLVDQCGPQCGPCVLLNDYFEANSEVLDKDYVRVKLDIRMAHADEIGKSLRSSEDGIPWMVILDANGKPLITSDGPNGNIGYPGSPQGLKQWEKMLRATGKRLTEADITVLLARLHDSG